MRIRWQAHDCGVTISWPDHRGMRSDVSRDDSGRITHYPEVIPVVSLQWTKSGPYRRSAGAVVMLTLS
jgi:hypothetical protein